jgi:hypothetical protein
MATAILSMGLGIVEFDPFTAAADDGSVETVGGAVRLMGSHSSVRMVSETVKARVGPDLVRVDCQFVFKNDGPADTVLIGFPDGASGPYMGGGEEYEIESFRSWVDEVEVECQRVPDADGVRAAVGSWWTKRVVFPVGAVRRIRNRYEVSPSWHPMGLGAEDSDSTDAYRAFRYVLWTGASWKGTIGTVEIFATLDGIPLDRVVTTSPDAQRADRTFRWTFHDFEPGSGGAPEVVELGWRVAKTREGD